MTGLGEALRNARTASGYTLEDVERETRIAQRYLIALENEDTAALPAPVYTRGFVRTYARHLGLDPDALLNQFPQIEENPGLWATPVVPDRPPTHLSRRLASIAIGVATLAALASAIAYGLSAGENGPSAVTTQPAEGQAPDDDQGRIVPISGPESSATPRTVDAPASGAPGAREMPDFLGHDLAAALSELQKLGAPYLLVETYSDRVDTGKVLQQTPRPGVQLDSKTSVTLVVSKGAAPPSPTATTSATPTPR